MANQYTISPERDAEISSCAESLGSINKAALELGISRSAAQDAVKRHIKRLEESSSPSVPTADELPPGDIDIEEVIALQEKRFVARKANADAKRWRKFHVPISGPYALMFVGDPHVDDNGCNWPLLKAHCKLAAETEGVYAINIGDSTNNWSGRLARLWAEQDTSASTAKAMASWLLNKSGMPWFMWLHGNHDMWDGPVGAAWFEAKKPHYVSMEDWQAKFTLVSPNGHELRVWAAHNFKGNSIWNNMHGLERAAQMQDWAQLYVAGHHHDVGLRQGENPHRNFCYWLARARGYKFIDHYADLHGFGHHQHGASVLAVIDPAADKPNAVQCFLDPFEGAEFLKWKRSKV